ncbi:MAG: CAP domain-containing protein [Dissulfurispiraceae bacterium]
MIFFILCMLCSTGYAQSNERDALSSRPNIDIAQLEKKIHSLLNKEREKSGFSALLWDESLHKAARKHSRDMVDRNFFSHNDPDGRGFQDRYEAEGIECKIRIGDTTYKGAENISQDNLYSSYVYKDGERSFNWISEDEIADSIVKRWMSSRAHRANVLTPYFKRQGIGVALSDDGKIYVTENFC